MENSNQYPIIVTILRARLVDPWMFLFVIPAFFNDFIMLLSLLIVTIIIIIIVYCVYELDSK